MTENMLNSISMENYMSDFLISLNNFCSKSVLQPKISCITETGKLLITPQYIPKAFLDQEKDVSFTFYIDPFRLKKDQIKEIKEILEPMYPVIFNLKSVRYTTDDIEKIINSGVPVTQALAMRKEEYLPRFRLVRIHNSTNELDCCDFKCGVMQKYKVNMPIIKFISQICDLEKNEGFEYFSKNTTFINDLV